MRLRSRPPGFGESLFLRRAASHAAGMHGTCEWDHLEGRMMADDKFKKFKLNPKLFWAFLFLAFWWFFLRR